MTWVILSLNILTGDFTLMGNFTRRDACITAVKTANTTEYVAHVRQCVQIDKKALTDYKLDKKDWSKLRT